MNLSLLSLLAATIAAGYPAPPLPPPPPASASALPVVSVPVSSAPRAPIAGRSAESARTLMFDLTLLHEGKTLWSGRLSMASNGSASYLQQIDQTIVCQDGEERRPTATFVPERVRISLRGVGGLQNRVRVSVEWLRSTEALDAPCLGAVSRTVSFEGDVATESGKTTVLTGDAGLRVEVRRR